MNPEPPPKRVRINPLLQLAGIAAVVVLIPAAPFLKSWLLPDPIYVQEPGHEVTGHRYLFDETLGWRNIPDWTATTHGQPLTTNSLGMRDRHHLREKPPATYRILVLGGSYTWGYGVADGETFADQLEHALSAATDRVEVLNAGVSGWGTDQALLFLEDEGLTYSPDIVLLSFLVTDHPGYNVRPVNFGLAKPLFMNLELQLGNSPVPRPGSTYPRVRCEADEVKLTLRILNRMAEFCARHDIPLVVMKFGAFHFRHAVDYRDDPQFQETLEQRDQAFLVPLTADERLQVLDLDAAFEARQLQLGALIAGNHDGHWNAYGHQQVAEILNEFLSEKSLLPAKRD